MSMLRPTIYSIVRFSTSCSRSKSCLQSWRTRLIYGLQEDIRSANKFESILEFPEACRDVVKALRCLYQDGKILHRDICIKNLIVASRRNEGDAKGVLIDLDGALDMEKDPARKGGLIGSERVMAIGILFGDPHTYRQDLESLFYVFLWVAICNDHEHNDQESLRCHPKTSRLWSWCSMDFKSVSRNKTIDMNPDKFLRILNEFSKEFELLEKSSRSWCSPYGMESSLQEPIWNKMVSTDSMMGRLMHSTGRSPLKRTRRLSR